eukprot:scaffold131_cov335-Pavlova_lutheri.AAC.1
MPKRTARKRESGSVDGLLAKQEVVENDSRVVDADFQCQVCANVFRDPFLTQCGHTFCYQCIWTHLKHSSTCPLCRRKVTRDKIFPNFLLGKLLKKLDQTSDILGQNFADKLHCALVNHDGITMQEIDSLMELMDEKKERMIREDRDAALRLLLEFLEYSKRRREDKLVEIHKNLRSVEEDIRSISGQFAGHLSFSTAEGSQNDGEDKSNRPTAASAELGSIQKALEDTLCTMSRKDEAGDPSALKERLLLHFDDLKSIYFESRQSANETANPSDSPRVGALVDSDGLGRFKDVLSKFLQYSKLEVQAEIKPGNLFHPANIISSIEVNATNTAFATAGVSKQITVYSFSSLLDCSEQSAPTTQMMAGSKLSCLTWNHQTIQHLASSAYAGVVSIWDADTGQSVMEFEEHQKRVWSVDFSKPDPNLLVSGGDDGRIKLWSTRQKHSVMSIDIKANVCCVRCSPVSSQCIAAGSADHQIHLYDIRHPGKPLSTIKGHRKAVSYVKFVDGENLLSASIDSTLKLWDMKENKIKRSFTGHTNDRNFVGLAVNEDFISCGSETNDVYVYYKELSNPLCTLSFNPGPASVTEVPDVSQFVSSVCWRTDCMTLLAANSAGIIKILSLT